MSYQPPYQQDPYAQPMPAQYGPPAPKKSNTGKIIGILALLLVLCCCGGIGVAWATGGLDSFKEGFQEGFEEGLNGGATTTAKVGDCVKQVTEKTETDPNATLDVVACTDSAASGKVLGILSGISKTTFDLENVEKTCAAYPTVEQAYWEGRTTTGKVWCIGPIG
jgi:hypothetical protein